MVSSSKSLSQSSFQERASDRPKGVATSPALLISDSKFGLPHSRKGVLVTRYLCDSPQSTPEELAEKLMLLANLLMGRSDESRDPFRDWRLNTDDMTYEQLLALGDKMGYVSTGLKEGEIQRSVKKTKFLGKTPSPFTEEAEPKCSICQEEYEPKDRLGLLICAHAYHRDCIKQWLRHKKTCPVCKSEALIPRR